MADTTILPVAQTLLDCLEEQLTLNPNPPEQVCLRAGDQVLHDVDGVSGLDAVCCPGLAYVRIGTVYPSSMFPAPDEVPGRNGSCYPMGWAAELVMGVVRCVPGMGTPEGPSCADWTQAATQDADDLDAMRRALCCWAERLPRSRLWLAQASPPPTLNADCIERMLPVLVSVPKCC